MATTTNINPWAAGAVVFDQRPYLAFYERQMAKEQAKRDAMDNYFRDLGKNITPTGMRSQDVPTLLKKQQEWNQLGTQQKAALVNPRLDNGKALGEFQSRYNDMLGLIQDSKGALKTMDEVGKMRLKPEMSYIADDPHFMDEIAKHELPIGDPNRSGINLATIALPPKPIGTKEREEHRKYVTGGLSADELMGRTENLPGFKTRTPIIKQYSPENLKIIGQRAMDAYDTDRSWRIESDRLFKEIMHDPIKYEQLNNTFKSVYGNEIDSPREARAAQDIVDNQMKATEYKLGEDTYGRELAMQRIRHANAKDLIKYKKEIDPEDTGLNNVWYQTYLDRLIDTAKTTGEKHWFKKGGKIVESYSMIKLDPFIAKAFMRGKSEPDRFGVTENGKIIPIFFKYKSEKEGGGVETTADGKPVVDTDYSQPMEYEQALVNMGYRGSTKKQLKEDQQKIQSGKKDGGAKHPLPTGQPRTVKQNGHTYTWSEISGTYE